MDAAPEPKRLLRRWGHSFEEDHDGVQVFRPADFTFPRARGRDGLEFRPDGSYVDWAIGAADGAEARPGTWVAEADGTVRLTGPDGRRRVVALIHVGTDRLEIRVRPR